MEQSKQLAKLWLTLDEVKTKIDNEILPGATHLGMDDEELMTALENLSREITAHQERFLLQARPVENGSKIGYTRNDR